MFKKIFSKMIRPWQILLLLFGSFLGLLIFWVSIQFYFDVSDALKKNDEIFGGQFLVLNKTVSVLHTLGIPSSGFSSEEIDEIKGLEGIQSVGGFTANTFSAMVGANMGQSGVGFKTQIFFEAVPNEFIDLKPSGWHWREEDDEVPIVLPADYLALYNFGFAPGQDLPQISEGLAQMTVFEMDISGNGAQKKLKGRIAGFSDRINTILVPQSFIDYGNKYFGSGEQKKPSRLIIRTDDVTALEALMTNNGYETNREKMQAGREQTIAKNIILIAIALGLIIVLLSLGTFLQFNDLLIARSEFEIKTLAYLGYGHKKIAGIIFYQVLVFILPSMLLALIVGAYIRWALLKLLAALFVKSKFYPTQESCLVFVGLLFIYLVVSYANIYFQTKKLSRAY